MFGLLAPYAPRITALRVTARYDFFRRKTQKNRTGAGRPRNAVITRLLPWVLPYSVERLYY